MTRDDLDAYADELLHRVVRPLALILRGQGPDVMVARWRELPTAEQEATVAMLAAAFPVEPPEADVYAWVNRTKVKPLHSDAYDESPRPLVAGALPDERFLPTGRGSRGWS